MVVLLLGSGVALPVAECLSVKGYTLNGIRFPKHETGLLRNFSRYYYKSRSAFLWQRKPSTLNPKPYIPIYVNLI